MKAGDVVYRWAADGRLWGFRILVIVDQRAVIVGPMGLSCVEVASLSDMAPSPEEAVRLASKKAIVEAESYEYNAVQARKRAARILKSRPKVREPIRGTSFKVVMLDDVVE